MNIDLSNADLVLFDQVAALLQKIKAQIIVVSAVGLKADFSNVNASQSWVFW